MAEEEVPQEVPRSCPLLDALQAVTPQDLAMIDEKLMALGVELEEVTTRINNEIAALEAVKNLVTLRLCGHPAAGHNGSASAGQPHRGRRRRGGLLPREPEEEPEDDSDDQRLSMRIMRMLKEQGPMAIQVIANRLEEPLPSVAVAVVRCKKLQRIEDKVSVVEPLIPSLT